MLSDGCLKKGLEPFRIGDCQVPARVRCYSGIALSEEVETTCHQIEEGKGLETHHVMLYQLYLVSMGELRYKIITSG